ncbi:hypothetical protein [Acinetobacter colistiniresistens]|uniref:hypothetical protein n=1 Tax=Acinetobacter colistiniresistens TaxID=280145 RepID=UPI00124FEDC7|nr:hypothetical protein [Acinetobacter colistiniresistens]
MSNFSLASLTETSPIITQIKTALAKAVSQNIVAVIIDPKLKKIGDEATKTATFNLENGQSAGFVFRKSGDILRFLLNGKDRPITGDLDPAYKPSFNAAITEIAEILRGNQPKFDKVKAREKVKIPQTKKDKALGTSTAIKVLTENMPKLDQQIEEKSNQKSELERQLTEIQNRPK